MATFNTVWSLDVGRASLKAVKLRRDRNNIEILAIDKVDYKPGENGVDTTERAKEAIGAFRIRNDVRDPVIVAHHGQGTLSRFIRIPAFEPKKIKEMVGYEASQQIPFPLEEVIWDYHIIEQEYLPGEEREVGLFAARRETIDDFLLDFTSEDLPVEGLTLGYLGLINYVFYDLAPEEPSIVLDMGASHTDLILVDGRKFWIRALPQSGNEINQSIMDRLKLGFAEAEKLKVEIARNPQQAAKLFQAIVQPKLKDLVNQIHQSIGFYRSQAGEVQFKKLYLLGNASKVIGIKKYLQEHLGVPVERVQTINNLRVNRDVDLKLLQSNLAAFGTAFGCGLQGLGVGTCQVDLIPQEEKIQKEIQRKKFHVFIGLAILILATLACGYLIKGKVERVRVSVDSAGSRLERPLAIEKQIKKIAIDDITEDANRLLSVADLRNRPFQGVSQISKELEKLGMGQSVQLVLEKPEDAAKLEKISEGAIEEASALNNKKIWIPWLSVRKVLYPEGSGQAGSGGAKRGTGNKTRGRKKKAELEPVAAYKFQVFAIVRDQGSPADSLKVIENSLQKPLQVSLGSDKRLLGAKVVISPDFESDLQRVERPSKFGSRSRGGGGARRGQMEPQEGGPFFGTELAWYMRVDEPKKSAGVDPKKAKGRGGKK